MRLAPLSICMLALTLQAQDDKAGQEARAERLKKLATQLGSDDLRTRWRAVRQIVRLGKSAVPTLTALLEKVYRDKRPRPEAEMAGVALNLLGPTAIECLPTVVKLLKDGSPEQLSLGMRVMQIVGPYDADEVEANKQLVYELKRNRGIVMKGGRVRQAAASRAQIIACLVRLTEDPDATVGALIEHLKGSSGEHIEMALERLAHFGDKAKQTGVAIREVLVGKQVRRTSFRFRGTTWGWGGSTSTNNWDRVRIKAAQLLVKIGADKDVRLQVHTALLKHEDPAIRQRSVLTLGSLGAEVDRAAVTALIAATSDSDKLVAWDAITALGMLGKAAQRALPRLRKLAEGDDKAKAARAEAAIKRIE